jgi:hypothetical protein
MRTELTDIDQARRIAHEYAEKMGVNEARAEAYAEVWFEAGKDADASSADALRKYLDRRFATQQ